MRALPYLVAQYAGGIVNSVASSLDPLFKPMRRRQAFGKEGRFI
jgi:hypothetical protein